MKAGTDNYCIIRGSAEPAGWLQLANSIEMAVNEYISEGWKAQGGIATAVFSDRIFMYQAMVKYGQPDNAQSTEKRTTDLDEILK